LEANVAAASLTKKWAAKFEAIRKPATPVIAADNSPTLIAEEFRQLLLGRIDKGMAEIFARESDKDLRMRLEGYGENMEELRQNQNCTIYLPEIGIKWPLETSGNHHVDRLRRKVLIEVVGRLRDAVADALGDQREVTPPQPVKPSPKAPSEPSSASEDHDIMVIAELMLSAKKRIAKTKETVVADIRILKEWTGNKGAITAYSKKDLIDFVQNCLPYLPANLSRLGNKYKGKTLRQCVKLTKDDPEQYPPIAHVTSGNRLDHIAMVFNYAKDHLGIININPAMGIEIPKVHIRKNLQRGFTPDELTAMWTALQMVKQEDTRPSRYWTTVLSLYHGFRLNEVCSLFLKDVYEDEDGVFVININADGLYKSVKNQSSVRIVPVHPFVRDQLGFKSFVVTQKGTRSNGVLFSDVTGNAVKGYRDRVSKWFAKWKIEWLASEAQHKHFHDLRYTFSQAAQNIAKMPDRHAQEITGHSIEGVSAVHLGYSGHLKPSALLEELTKVRYGWE
jgi:integrase